MTRPSGFIKIYAPLTIIVWGILINFAITQTLAACQAERTQDVGGAHCFMNRVSLCDDSYACYQLEKRPVLRYVGYFWDPLNYRYRIIPGLVTVEAVDY